MIEARSPKGIVTFKYQDGKLVDHEDELTASLFDNMVLISKDSYLEPSDFYIAQTLRSFGFSVKDLDPKVLIDGEIY